MGVTDASQDEWWRHDNEPDERMRALRRGSASTRTTRRGVGVEAARRYRREASPHQEVYGEPSRKPARVQASTRWGDRGHDMPQIPERRRRAVQARQVQLTPQRPVPQIRDRTARNGGWNVPSLSARRAPRVPAPLVAAIAVLLVVLAALLVHSCVA